jgi:hypothetical protein
MLKNSVRFFAMFAAISAAEATTVKIVNHDYTGVSSAFPKNTPYYGYVEFTHPQGNFEIQLPDAGHEASVQNKPVDNYTKIRVVRGEGTQYKRSAVCALPYYKNGNTLIVNVHFANEKILCNIIRDN